MYFGLSQYLLPEQNIFHIRVLQKVHENGIKRQVHVSKIKKKSMHMSHIEKSYEIKGKSVMVVTGRWGRSWNRKGD